jgi:ribosomal protein S7
MHVFTDATGRNWTITINVAALKKIKALTGVNLLELLDNNLEGLSALLSDVVKLVDILYVLCKDQADTLGISDEDFGRALGGDSLEQAVDAFLEEFVDFFPNRRAREALRKMLSKGKTITEKAMQQALEKIEQVNIENEVMKLLNSSGTAPAS